ncbi:MAG: YdjY domain-containing protein [Pseudomonadota bacterium]
MRLSPIAVMLLAAQAAVSFASDSMHGLSGKTPMIVDRQAGESRLLATLQPKAFGPGWLKQLPGHHAVTWSGGRKSHEALLSTYSSDTAVYDALISLGAKPGDDLTQEVWDERNNPQSSAPDRRVEGDPVAALVWWQGLKEPMPLSALLHNPTGKRIDLRFGGHKSLIPVWKCGCIVCMQSCPGAKVSNRSSTIRDYVDGKALFTVNEAVVPKGERKAVVILRLTDKTGLARWP